MRYHRPWAGSSTAEQLTLNQLVESSNLSRLTIASRTNQALGDDPGALRFGSVPPAVPPSFDPAAGRRKIASIRSAARSICRAFRPASRRQWARRGAPIIPAFAISSGVASSGRTSCRPMRRGRISRLPAARRLRSTTPSPSRRQSSRRARSTAASRRRSSASEPFPRPRVEPLLWCASFASTSSWQSATGSSRRDRRTSRK